MNDPEMWVADIEEGFWDYQGTDSGWQVNVIDMGDPALSFGIAEHRYSWSVRDWQGREVASGQCDEVWDAKAEAEAAYRLTHELTARRRTRTASTDLVARGIGYVKVPTRELCRKFVDGTVTAQEIVDMVLQDNNGRAGVWWGSIGDNEWDYYDYEDAPFHHAYYSSNAYPELILEECEEADEAGGFGDEYYRNNPADVGVVLWAEHPYVNGTFWNPLTDNRPLPGHESQSYVPEGTQLRLVRVGWVDAVNDETILPANGMTVTASLGGQGITVTAEKKAAAPQMLYRGIRVTYDRTPFADQLREIAASGQGQIGEEVLDYLATASPHASLDGVSLGRHWTTDYNVATGIASVMAKEGEKGGIVLTAQWDGQGTDEAKSYVGGDYPEESEVTLLPGTKVTVVKAELVTGYSGQPIPVWSGTSMRTAVLRTAAEPGGKLPYVPSDFGYQWYEEPSGEYAAETRDGKSTMFLDIAGTWVNWSVYDEEGLVERGNFGVGDPGIQGILYRADRLLAEFDENPAIPAKSWGYDRDYTEDFPTNFPAPNFMQP